MPFTATYVLVDSTLRNNYKNTWWPAILYFLAILSSNVWVFIIDVQQPTYLLPTYLLTGTTIRTLGDRPFYTSSQVYLPTLGIHHRCPATYLPHASSPLWEYGSHLGEKRRVECILLLCKVKKTWGSRSRINAAAGWFTLTTEQFFRILIMFIFAFG